MCLQRKSFGFCCADELGVIIHSRVSVFIVDIHCFLVCNIPHATMFVTCFSGSASHLVGAHCARVVCVEILKDLLYDPGNQLLY